MTFYICFGKYAGFRIEKKNKYTIIRVVLGVLSIAVVSTDIEILLERCLTKIGNLNRSVSILENELSSYTINTTNVKGDSNEIK